LRHSDMKSPLLVVSFLLVCSAFAEPVRIYLGEDDHTDFMWTADAETYERVFVEMLDHHLELAAQTEGNEPNYRHRFNCDGNHWLWSYERKTSQARFNRLMERVKDGTISAPLNALVSCYGGQPTEAVLRGMYYAGRLERRFGVRFRLAVAMENQTFPLGLASLWAGAGADYSWRGICGCASRMRNRELAHRDHEIYWCAGPDGGRVLMKWHSFALPGGSKRSGGYAEAFDPVKAIEFLDKDSDFLARYRPAGATQAYRVRAAFGFGWDALDRKTGEPYAPNPKQYPFVDHFHRIAKAASGADRQVIVSNEEDFFRDFSARYSEQLPTESLSYGNEWDLYSASLAETSARVRRAVEALRTAEALATVVSLQDPGLLPDRMAARDQAFQDLGLFWEHDWTADGPITREARAEWQRKLAAEIEGYVEGLRSDAVSALSKLIAAPTGFQRFFVFNALGWVRTDVADLPYEDRQAVEVVDLTSGQIVEHQFMEDSGKRSLRILARDLPPVGYRIYEVRKASSGSAAPDFAAIADGRVLENSRVKLVLDSDGAIASLIDKRKPELDLAANIDGLKVNDFAANQSGGQGPVIENAGPVSVTVRLTSDAGRNHVTRVTLYRDSDRIDLVNEIAENFGDVRHWAFSFNLASPRVRTEELGAILRLGRKDEGGYYADRNARYDYATLNHFADITDGTGSRGVTLSNWDCAFVRLGRSSPDALDTKTAQLNVLAGGQVDGDQLGIRNQGGATHFLQRFALRPQRGYDAAVAMRFALEHQNPLIAGPATGLPNAPLREESYSLVSIGDPQVLLWAIKPAEEGIAKGVIARFWNVADIPTTTTVAFGDDIAEACRTTHLETDLEPVSLDGQGALSATLARQQIRTYRFLFRPNISR
jgi:alpha-mannosidase